MKKHRRSATKLLLATIVLTAGMSITSWAMTAEEVTAKNPTSYTAGSNSIYGPSQSGAVKGRGTGNSGLCNQQYHRGNEQRPENPGRV